LLCALVLAAATLVVAPDELSVSLRSLPPADTPHPEEVRLLEELSAWATADPEADESEPFLGGDLAQAVRARNESFRIFCLAPGRAVSALHLTALPYAPEILDAAERQGVDAFLLAAMVEAESSFDATALSPRGALGLLQVMPTTAMELGVSDPQNPGDNLQAGARYLSDLLDRFDGDLALALAAYNAGPTVVARYGGIPPYPETLAYVDRVLRKYLDYRQVVWDATGGPLWASTANDDVPLDQATAAQ
jgi:soluble lytic murein transglycosylase-like protein